MAVWWLEDFDKRTKDKSNGRHRLLLVDGHNSHYSLAFLKYAQDAKIVVLCYPSHTTHVLQGLDVVAFAILKKRWHRERDTWERENWGQSLQKGTFLELFGRVYTETMTPTLVRECFRKTGVVPLDRNVVSSRQIAPSVEHSSHIDTSDLSTPVKRILKFQRQLIALDHPDEDANLPLFHPCQDPNMFSVLAEDADDDDDDDELCGAEAVGLVRRHGDEESMEMDADFMASVDPSLRPMCHSEFEVDAIDRASDIDLHSGGENEDEGPQPRAPPVLCRHHRETPESLLQKVFEGSSAGFLANDSPITSNFELPEPLYGGIARVALSNWATKPPASGRRTKAGLEAENEALRRDVVTCQQALRNGAQTVTVLNGQLVTSKMAFAKVRMQLAAQETKRVAPKRKEIATSLGRVLTHESFLEVLDEMAQRQSDADATKLAKDLIEKDWNKYLDEYNEGVTMWKAEVTRRKVEGIKGRYLKPKKMQKKDWLDARAGIHTISHDGVEERAGSDNDEAEE